MVLLVEFQTRKVGIGPDADTLFRVSLWDAAVWRCDTKSNEHIQPPQIVQVFSSPRVFFRQSHKIRIPRCTKSPGIAHPGI